MLIKIRYPNTVTLMISFVSTWWIINEFEKDCSNGHTFALHYNMVKSFNLFFLSESNTGHYPGAVNIPFPSLFNSDTRTLKTVDELKKGWLFPSYS